MIEKFRPDPSKPYRPRGVHLILVVAICLLSPLGPIWPGIGAGTENQEELTLSWMKEPPAYQREGRPDPFLPFISEKMVQGEVPQEELTGMRRFEPGQLTLVSVVFTEEGPLAMVQDSAGRGYIIREGNKIGRSGVVAQIVANKVVIEQKISTVSGETRLQTVEMVLRKEGEK